MLSPRLLRALTEPGVDPALALFRARSPARPAAFNLCASSVRRGELDDDVLLRFCAEQACWRERLLACWSGA